MGSILPLRQPHSQALALSQQASRFLQRTSSSTIVRIAVPLVSSTESSGLWAECEELLLSCLRTGDDKGAFLCLDKLIGRFGATNERVMGLRGLYQEAVAGDEAGLRKVLQEYNEVLAEDPTNTPILKRRVALLRILQRPSDAADALTELLESSPTDIEAWTELADLYVTQGMQSQAIFCYEEVLLVAPNAWNIHARLGEVLYALSTSNGNDRAAITQSLRRFCRSVELCDGYIRGYYGLKKASDLLLSLAQTHPGISATDTDSESSVATMRAIRSLNEQATFKLAEAIRRGSGAGQPDAELVAVRALLDDSTQSRVR